jgi:hypothetical protein
MDLNSDITLIFKDNVRLNEPEEIILYKKAKALLKQLKTK